MVYVITDYPENFPLNPIYRIADKTIVLNWLESIQEIPIDAETTGFDPHTDKLQCIQVGDYNNQFVIDCTQGLPNWVQPALRDKILIGHNLKFDLGFLYKLGWYHTKIYDTFVVEKILYCGLAMVQAGLDDTVERYCKVKLDKSMQALIAKEGLTPRAIAYAADDVKYLIPVKEAQEKLAIRQDLTEVVKLENAFTPALTYLEYCGFKLNVDKWKAKVAKDNVRMAEKEKALDDWVFANNLTWAIESQLDMFQAQEVKINWASPAQVADFFIKLGIDATVKSGEGRKKSVEESVIAKYKAEHPIVAMYLDYKKAEKVCTTYGDNFLTQINPATGRIHTYFKQILDTGRTASGGKQGDKQLVNFQNIPADPETRACFEAEEGNTLIVADYSGQEQIVLANMCLDPVLLDFYDKGEGDMHSFVASVMYGVDMQKILVAKEKKENKIPLDPEDKLMLGYRQDAKEASFAINYGGNGTTIANNKGIPVSEGDKIYNAYFKAFPGLKKHFDSAKKQGLNDGYILISKLTRRKSYIHYYKRYAELRNECRGDFWDKYRYAKEHKTDAFPELSKKVRDMFYYQGEIERMSLNYPIQGSSAELVKLAQIYIFNWILENNLFGVVKMCNAIHDELVPECPIDMAEKVAKVVEHFMFKAGQFFCKRVPLYATPDITKHWRK